VKRLATWTLRILLGGAVLYGATVAYVRWLAGQDQRRRVDAIVVLGAAHYNGRPSRVLRARLDHAADLFEAGLAPVIVVTGGMAEGDRVSEATVSQQYLKGRKVPPTAIVVRPDGRNSHESIVSAAEWLEDHEMHSVLLVSDPFHMARLRLEARRTGLQVLTSPTRTSPIVPGSRTEFGYLAQEALKLPVAAVYLMFRKP
jgi:uncharacterized SAM-binding protein YcdF (DUF218 family)